MDDRARTRAADLPVPGWQKAELEHRRQEYLQSPDTVTPWSEVKRSILESACQR